MGLLRAAEAENVRLERELTEAHRQLSEQSDEAWFAEVAARAETEKSEQQRRTHAALRSLGWPGLPWLADDGKVKQ